MSCSIDTITLGDIGTDLQITVTEAGTAVDISSAAVLEVLLTKPSGTEIARTASRLNGGTDGKLHYTTVAGDIDERGIWSYRARVTFSPSQVYHSIEPQQFRVV